MNEELGMLFSNIQSLLAEIGQALGIGGQAPAQPAADQTAEMQKQEMTDEEKKKQEDLAKGLEETPSDGVTATDSAETRADETATDISEENTNEVAKALFAILKGTMDKKDASKPKIEKSSSNEVLAEMTKVLKQLAVNQTEIQKKQTDTESAIMNILKGLKIADEVEKSIQTQPVQKGLNNPKDNEQIAKLLKALTSKGEEEKTETAFDRSQYVQKSLRNPEILKALTGIKG
jgi:hypothetical protein